MIRSHHRISMLTCSDAVDESRIYHHIVETPSDIARSRTSSIAPSSIGICTIRIAMTKRIDEMAFIHQPSYLRSLDRQETDTILILFGSSYIDRTMTDIEITRDDHLVISILAPLHIVSESVIVR